MARQAARLEGHILRAVHGRQLGRRREACPNAGTRPASRHCPSGQRAEVPDEQVVRLDPKGTTFGRSGRHPVSAAARHPHLKATKPSYSRICDL
jgi:hypothetical protein